MVPIYTDATAAAMGLPPDFVPPPFLASMLQSGLPSQLRPPPPAAAIVGDSALSPAIVAVAQYVVLVCVAVIYAWARRFAITTPAQLPSYLALHMHLSALELFVLAQIALHLPAHLLAMLRRRRHNYHQRLYMGGGAAPGWGLFDVFAGAAAAVQGARLICRQFSVYAVAFLLAAQALSR